MEKSSRINSEDSSEVQLDHSELVMLRKAVEASGEVIFLADCEGIITYVNPEFTRLYGYTAEEVIGISTPRILKSGKLSDRDYEEFWDILLSKNIVRGEFVNKSKDGRLVTIEGSANPILDENENIIGFLAIQRDITRRKQSQKALEEAHAFQQSILDGISDPIMVIRGDYRVTLMNRAARQFSFNDAVEGNPLLCYQVSHQSEKPCEGLEHPCPITQVRDTSKTVVVEHEHYQADGQLRLVEIIASPMVDLDGAFQGIIEVMRDITERRDAEKQLQQYTTQLRVLAIQLTEVAETERQRLAQELHDQVGQNLTALGININIIRSQLPEDVDQSLHFHLDDSSALVEQTTERIRDVMANLRPPVLDDYGLMAALRWYANQFVRRTDINVIVKGEILLPRLDSRVENALFRIVQEALTNSAKHARASKVTIRVDQESGFLRLEIADDGVGFDTSQSVDYDQGRGWGVLSMTERAEAVGGSCAINSNIGHGTQVIVEVPR